MQNRLRGLAMKAVRVSVVVLALLVGMPVLPADAAPKPKPKAKPKQSASACKPANVSKIRELTAEPWHQKRLGLERVWKISRGRGVKVAVIDSGVAANLPELKDHINATGLTGTGGDDCVGHGTQVAGLLAARPVRAGDLQVQGVAPDAFLICIKVQDTQELEGTNLNIPRAIRAAADAGARVINISITTSPSKQLAAAVKYAQSKNAVIVAAAGNLSQQGGDDIIQYPAGYPGVISVGMLDQNGSLSQQSNTKTPVTVSAPGVDLPTLWRGGGYDFKTGTSMATPLVSGVAALIISKYPRMSAAQVVERISSTAEGAHGAGTGAGMINPYQAVTAAFTGTVPGQPTQPAVQVKLLQGPAPDERTTTIAYSVAFGSLGFAALAALGAVVVPIGRRRAWLPGGRAGR
jgi:type VII secretion-associated serine protease mycosin